ncbi:MAG: bifunctional (p)ppGpp synthetase/guanosine-3',5'-bis(diphosphate) 3'-pyrophosphohydrolase [Candidatus Pacebacteria bacterium]|nr:bifunctional (p)ppGpp synthetase/guanosine-3',5'-bis(diphosphate) 3'-pyrophosphohydrolase [Candidatus Paceibacterota bacterium]
METRLENLLSLYTSDVDRELITRAARFAENAHSKHLRESGEPYFLHLLATAENLAALGSDAATVAAGFLHDTIEDTDITADDIKREFGDEILFLVEGVTKLGKLKYRGLKRHVETLRKLFMATAEDPRVILIKLADRLHNLRSIDALAREKQLRIAQETLEIYAPIAHRLGIGTLKGELEDLSFKITKPEEHEHTKTLRDQKTTQAEVQLTLMEDELRTLLAEAKVDVISMDHRVKHLYSLHKKLRDKDMNIDEIYDIAALRIIVPTLEACYLTLGLIHSAWKPLPGRIKDYIAMPKSNGYQSLHTTVFTGEGSLIEIQVRTPEMHAVAELGIASHVSYKEKRTQNAAQEIEDLRKLLDLPNAPKTKEWLTELAGAPKAAEDSAYLEEIKTDFFGDHILVFTPRGEVVDLPQDATPIDFAYAIHTDLGDHASGARVNGKFVALGTPLKNGDIVLIEEKEGAKPSTKWLQWAKTSSARKKIRLALGLTEESTG